MESYTAGEGILNWSWELNTLSPVTSSKERHLAVPLDPLYLQAVTSSFTLYPVEHLPACILTIAGFLLSGTAPDWRVCTKTHDKKDGDLHESRSWTIDPVAKRHQVSH